MDEMFVKICKITDLKENKGYRFEIDEENEIAVFKIGKEIFAVDNICPHNHTSKIFQGELEDMHVICPVHGYKFSLYTGKQPLESGCRLRTFEIKISGDSLFVKKPEAKRFNFNF